MQVAAPEPEVHGTRWDRADSLSLAVILAVALLVRLVLFTGFFGSDETHYSREALAIATGQWQLPDYIGRLRLGMNVPLALSVMVFGHNLAALNLWPLLCSLCEIALVFYIAHVLWGRRAAILSSILLAFLPLHIHFAGRIMADPPLAFFITLSFVAFFIAERRHHTRWYLAAGAAAGFVFWLKEVTVIFVAAFALYAIVFRRWSNRWLWTVAGAGLVIAANSIVFWIVAGDPGYIFKNISHKIVPTYVQAPPGFVHFSPLYYFSLMLTDLRDLWIMPYFALAGLVILGKRLIAARSLEEGAAYVLVWGIGLVGIFSFMIISLKPLTFIGKQGSYMLIFAAPLCLLAGYVLARFRGALLGTVLAIMMAGGMILAVLERQGILVFTSNSKAALAFASAHRDAPVYGTANAARIATTVAAMEGKPASIMTARDLYKPTVANASKDTAGPPSSVYVIVDPQAAQMDGNPVKSLADVPACWVKVATLKPAGLGWLGELVEGRDLTGSLPGWLQRPLDRYQANPLKPPKTAHVFRVSAGCPPYSG